MCGSAGAGDADHQGILFIKQRVSQHYTAHLANIMHKLLRMRIYRIDSSTLHNQPSPTSVRSCIGVLVMGVLCNAMLYRSLLCWQGKPEVMDRFQAG